MISLGPARKAFTYACIGIIAAGTAAFGVTATLGAGISHAATAPQVMPNPVRIMPLGDSITAGSGSTTKAGYRAPLWNLISAQNRYSADFVGSRSAGEVADPDNEGHSGYKVAGIRASIDQWQESSYPDAVLLHLGINDLRAGADPLAAAEELSSLIDRIRSNQPTVTVLVQGLLVDTRGQEARAATYNSSVKANIAARLDTGQHVRYFDSPRLDVTTELPDGLHPNDAGYRKMAAVYNAALEQATTDGWIQHRFPNGVPLPAGTSLGNGEVLTSKASKLAMNNGVLSITTNAGKVIWSAGTSGNPGARAVMEDSGNLAICAPAATDADLAACASDTTKTKRLWSTNIPAVTADPNNSAAGAGGVAVLQNRGNLVIYNAKGQSLWTSGTAPRNDYNGDGRSDMAAWYSYSDGHSALQTIKSNADGSLAQPFQSYSSAIGSWNIDKIQLTTGDYNGDGRGDTAIMANYGNGKAQLFTSLGKPDGGFEAPFVAWTSTPGSWYAERATLHSGDFDGDGRDDIAAWYDYSDGRDTLHTFTSTPKGSFNAPFSSWSNPKDWNVDNMKFATGDFDADGRDDIGGLYRFADGSIKMFSFLTTADGKFQASQGSWASSTFGDWNRTNVHAGDFNADGRDDIAAWYDYSDGRDAVHFLSAKSDPDGHFSTPVQIYETAAGNFHYAHMRMVAGDYNGDGRDDLAAMYGYSDGKVRMFTWTANKDNRLNGALAGWTSATTTSWNINVSTFLRNAN
ncbi:FG-GAP-like repeat-containing protein (plasmid) [Streptomyces sp. CA-294286]|uniref:FG-GAP-like repeat-containing protein n=1 Tax=Streptomyces sp. CA-294286 TaxID=3240070 RepID=UPI003D8B0F71